MADNNQGQNLNKQDLNNNPVEFTPSQELKEEVSRQGKGESKTMGASHSRSKGGGKQKSKRR